MPFPGGLKWCQALVVYAWHVQCSGWLVRRFLVLGLLLVRGPLSDPKIIVPEDSLDWL